MFNKVKKVISLLAIPLTLTYLSSCSFFNTGKEDSYMIKSIEAEQFEDGSTKVTITYDDEEKEPVVFYIPKGEQGDIGETGATGNGIAGIENKGTDETGKYTIMEITYTDTSIPSTEFKVPNGASIDRIESSYNDTTGFVTVKITLSNGDSLSFDLPRGKDGNGISNIEQIVNADKSVTLIIHFTEGGTTTVEIPAPKDGEDGRGISSMISTETNDKYIITVNYTDGTSDVLELTRPTDPNNWYTGYGIPENSFGKNGDFYFDIDNKNIYGKSGGRWSLIYSFTDTGDVYEVTFDLNDTIDAPATMKGQLSYQIERGTYFAASGYKIPEPTRTGYEFVGWYTTKEPGPTNGAFTDLTPVFADLQLYAKWIIA